MANSCFTILSRNGGNCFKVNTRLGEGCFKVISKVYPDDEELPLPPELPTFGIPGFTKIRDIIKNGLNKIIVLGWYIPTIGGDTLEVIAEVEYIGGITGGIGQITNVVNFEELSYFDVSITDASLESFDITSGMSNVAIKTSSKIVYISTALFTEISTVTDGSAIMYPFATTDDTYWTNTEHWNGDYMYSGIPVSVSYTSNTDLGGCGSPYGDYDGAIALGIMTESKAGVFAGVGFPRVEKSGCKWIPDEGGGYGYAYAAKSGQASEPEYLGASSATGFKTIAKSIIDASISYIGGKNSFTNNLVSLPAIPMEETPGSIWTTFSGQTRGVRGKACPMPLEVDLTAPFLNIRPGYTFGEGYIAVGEIKDRSVIFAWEIASGKYNHSGFFHNHPLEHLKSGTGHMVYSSSNVEGVDFYLVPFTGTDLKKVQVGESWISMGCISISSDFGRIVDSMPELYGIPSAIVGDRCLVPIETPEEGEDGVFATIDQSFLLSENSTGTRPVIFPTC